MRACWFWLLVEHMCLFMLLRMLLLLNRLDRLLRLASWLRDPSWFWGVSREWWRTG